RTGRTNHGCRPRRPGAPSPAPATPPVLTAAATPAPLGRRRPGRPKLSTEGRQRHPLALADQAIHTPQPAQVSARIQHAVRKRRETTGTFRTMRTRERVAPLPSGATRGPCSEPVKPQVRLPDVQAC